MFRLNKICLDYCSWIDSREMDIGIKSQLKIEFLLIFLLFIKTLKEPTQSQVAQNLKSVVEVYDYIVNRTNALEKESNDHKVNNQFNFNKPNFKNPLNLIKAKIIKIKILPLDSKTTLIQDLTITIIIIIISAILVHKITLCKSPIIPIDPKDYTHQWNGIILYRSIF